MKFNKFANPKFQKGVTMIEYALIAALIAVVAIAGLKVIGVDLLAKFNAIATSLQ